jgi:ABC-type transport system substrate-binding protein
MNTKQRPDALARLKRRGGVLAAAMAMGFAAPAIAGPADVITVVDPSPVNWLSITWNTMEELVRVDENGRTVPTLAKSWRWIDNKTVEFKLRDGVTFHDDEKFTGPVFRRSFDEVQRWDNPHPPGAFLNFAKTTKLDVVDDKTVRFTFPEADGSSVMKFRGMHVASTRFWDELGFVSKKTKSGEGSW